MANSSISCVARDEVKAVRILDELKAAGFSEDRTSVLIPEKAIPSGFGSTRIAKSSMPPGSGLATGLLAGILDRMVDVGILTRQNLGRFIGAGFLMASFNAPQTQSEPRAILEVPAGSNAMARLIEHYQDSLHDGKILVSVQSDSPEEISRLSKILQSAGGEDIATTELGAASNEPQLAHPSDKAA